MNTYKLYIRDVGGYKLMKTVKLDREPINIVKSDEVYTLVNSHHDCKGTYCSFYEPCNSTYDLYLEKWV